MFNGALPYNMYNVPTYLIQRREGNKMKNLLSTLTLALTITACGGGSDTASTPSQPAKPTPPPIIELVTPAGVWEGFVTDYQGNSYEISGMITPDGLGKFVIDDQQGNTLAHQSINMTLFNSNEYMATIKEFTKNGALYDVDNGTLTGTYSDSYIDGVAMFNGVETSRLQLYKSVHSNAGASFDLLKGDYSDSIAGISTFKIDSNGALMLKFTDSHCQSVEQVVIPDSDINVYTFDFKFCTDYGITNGTAYAALITANGQQGLAVIFEFPAAAESYIYLKH